MQLVNSSVAAREIDLIKLNKIGHWLKDDTEVKSKT